MNEPIDGAARSVSVSRTIAVAAPAIFSVLTDPSLHAVIDGSGTVRAPRGNPDRLTLGAKFAMNMRLGVPYAISNTVVEFEPDRLIAWRHIGGHRWRYELEQIDESTTRVTETFDWSTARLPWLIDRIGAPSRHVSDMERTLERLDAFVTNRVQAL